jgi:estrone sulfotransferase
MIYTFHSQDLPAVIRKTALFLGKDLNEKQVNELADHLSFGSMKTNPAVNLEDFVRVERERHGLSEQPDLHFIRQGETGNWRREMTQDMADRVDAWTAQRLESTGYNVEINRVSNGNASPGAGRHGKQADGQNLHAV